MPICWYVAICCVVLRCAHSTTEASIAIDENTKLVIFGMRHGNCHPRKFLNENSRTWGFEGVDELTQVGRLVPFQSL